ncbi:DUF6894 family protein [Sphingomonas nostoxanthinifaciens]|uniref:DUF6894 family protein n=1 Tax=Sphingomonas nostoxanthinifaciens TaxID=2872652 RepID=UPI001CC1EB7D|nr:hypothetical protein [Sphingomonas nostoxanthinifaciens]UAK25663.1 hypothetical protein K8P63_05825 [Sphingomonas nostoxanthinifaciens]
MSRFLIKFDGTDEQLEGDYASVDEARNAAISILGEYLQKTPEFAYRQHWRVDVRDHAQRLVFHVIVATVAAPPPINWESFDKKPSTYIKDGRPLGR